MKRILTVFVCSLLAAIALFNCSGGGSSGLNLAKGLSGLGNPGADGPVKISLELLDTTLSVQQGSSINFRVAAEFKNLGSNSRGTAVVAECPPGSSCSVSRLPQNSGGTVTVTMHTTHQLEVGQHTIKVLGQESHFGALGGLGSLAVLTKVLEVRVNVTQGDSKFAFNRWAVQLEAYAKPGPIHSLNLENGAQLVTAGSDKTVMGYHFENCATSCSFARSEVRLRDSSTVEATWNLEDAQSADYDNDGLLDVVLTSTSGVILHPAKSELAFGNPILVPFDFPIYELEIADLDGDGLMDIVGSAPDGGKLAIVFTKAPGDTFEPVTLDTSSGAKNFGVGDIDADGDADIVLVNPVRGLDIYTNDSNGRFTYRVSLEGSVSFDDIEMVDIDQDLAADIIVSNASNKRVLVFFGGADLQALRRTVLDTTDASASLAIGDFNGDELMDIAALSTELPRIAVFAGYGTDLFDEQVFITTEIGCAEGEDCNRLPMHLVAGDFNRDGTSDIATMVPSTACLSRCQVNYGTIVFQLADPNR
jgi:hypothetical protein